MFAAVAAGKHEIRYEFAPDSPKSGAGGKGVLQAVENINTEISESVLGLDASEQAFIDKTLVELDGTANKSRLGANAILAVDKLNPQNAARMVPPLGRWRRFGPERQALMKAELERMREQVQNLE